MIICVFQRIRFFGSTQTTLLCIVGELAGEGSMAMAVGISDVPLVIGEVIETPISHGNFFLEITYKCLKEGISDMTSFCHRKKLL